MKPAYSRSNARAEPSIVFAIFILTLVVLGNQSRAAAEPTKYDYSRTDPLGLSVGELCDIRLTDGERFRNVTVSALNEKILKVKVRGLVSELAIPRSRIAVVVKLQDSRRNAQERESLTAWNTEIMLGGNFLFSTGKLAVLDQFDLRPTLGLFGRKIGNHVLPFEDELGLLSTVGRFTDGAEREIFVVDTFAAWKRTFSFYTFRFYMLHGLGLSILQLRSYNIDRFQTTGVALSEIGLRIDLNQSVALYPAGFVTCWHDSQNLILAVGFGLRFGIHLF